MSVPGDKEDLRPESAADPEASPDNGEQTEIENGMSLWDHVEELRWVILKCLLAFSVVAVVFLVFSPTIAGWLYWPLHTAQSMTSIPDDALILRTRGPISVFSVILQLGFLGGFALSLPFMLYFIAGFIAPGLNERELRVLRPLCVSIASLFVLGAAFGFFILLPAMLAVSFHFNLMFGFQPWWDPSQYFGLVLWMTVGLGVIFQFPVALVLLQWLEMLQGRTLRHYRRHAIVIMLILSAFITPSDPGTLVIMVIPLWLLYEASIVIGEHLVRRQLK